jgi:hypothetical protein
MEMTDPCFHCPASIWLMSSILFVAISIFVAGVMLSAAHRLLVRVIGRGLATLGVLLMIVAAMSAFRYGVSWEGSVHARDVTLTLLFACAPVAFLVAAIVKRWRLRN